MSSFKQHELIYISMHGDQYNAERFVSEDCSRYMYISRTCNIIVCFTWYFSSIIIHNIHWHIRYKTVFINIQKTRPGIWSLIAFKSLIKARNFSTNKEKLLSAYYCLQIWNGIFYILKKKNTSSIMNDSTRNNHQKYFRLITFKLIYNCL